MTCTKPEMMIAGLMVLSARFVESLFGFFMALLAESDQVIKPVGILEIRKFPNRLYVVGLDLTRSNLFTGRSALLTSVVIALLNLGCNRLPVFAIVNRSAEPTRIIFPFQRMLPHPGVKALARAKPAVSALGRGSEGSAALLAGRLVARLSEMFDIADGMNCGAFPTAILARPGGVIRKLLAAFRADALHFLDTSLLIALAAAIYHGPALVVRKLFSADWASGRHLLIRVLCTWHENLRYVATWITDDRRESLCANVNRCMKLGG